MDENDGIIGRMTEKSMGEVKFKASSLNYSVKFLFHRPLVIHSSLKTLSTNLLKYRSVIWKFIPITVLSFANHLMSDIKSFDELPIVGFHMTSLKFELKDYRSYRDFTFTVH